MAKTAFLGREQYWREIESRIPSATNVMAAVAYFGKGGSEYLPLRSGDSLVVDLSLSAVKQGVTDPREIKKLINRGVHVFTRSSLHAKVVVIDEAVLTTSANVSQNARRYLDEAAILSTSPATVQAAKRFVRSMCSEPVLPRYLKECISLYRPPFFKAARTVRRIEQRKRSAKLWLIGGLVYIDPQRDRSQIESLERKAAKELMDPNRSEVGWIRMEYCPRWFNDIQRNNWVIDCVRADERRHDIGSPGRVIRKRRYTTKAGKTYYMLMLERLVAGEVMSLPMFRQRWRETGLSGTEPFKRSRPVADETLADRALKFWTPNGRISKRAARNS